MEKRRMMKWKAAALGLAALLIGGCASASLKNTVWVPERLENQGDVKLVGDTPAWFEICETGKVFGCSGVNRFSSQAVIGPEKGELSFTSGPATLMAGPNLGYEKKFTETLNAVRRYSIHGDTLTVADGDGKVLGTFKAGAAEVKERK